MSKTDDDRPELVGYQETDADRCPKCGRGGQPWDGPIYKNGTELCGVCYGIKMDYYANPEELPAYQRGWADDE